MGEEKVIETNDKEIYEALKWGARAQSPETKQRITYRRNTKIMSCGESAGAPGDTRKISKSH